MEKCALRFTFSQVFPPKCVSFLGIAGKWCRNRLRWIINYTPLPTWCCVIAWHYRYLEFSKVFHCDRFALRCRRTKCCVKMSNTANVCLSLHCPVYIQCCVYSITTKVEAKWPWPFAWLVHSEFSPEQVEHGVYSIEARQPLNECHHDIISHVVIFFNFPS